jgi:AraC-like DNA-binding protein
MTASLVTSEPAFASFRFDDADEVRAFYADEYFACVGLGELSPGQRFAAAADQIVLGPLEVTEHRLTVDMTVRFHRDDVYAVCLNSSGLLSVEQHGDTVVSTPTRAAVYRPAAPGLIHSGPTEAYSRAHGLVVKTWAVAAELELLLDRSVPPLIPLIPVMDLTSPECRTWLRLLGLFTDALHRRDATIFQPMVAEPLSHALLTGLLLASAHPFSEALHRPAATCRPRHVKIALDAMHDHPEYAHTSASLADRARVSVRNLQEGFRRHVGVPPMAYLRQLRLAHAHDDLRTGRAVTVAEAAHRWGFSHLGRFAAAYRAKYGALPSAARAGLTAHCDLRG